ncbi:hypothetical protein [Microvirga massiliensis]|uniref:hypothetical protein n=1 Tax=Microvirga massiliensis TaxID=1033741 RepID=UPI00062B5379|nr:hypothetical protein [Microvirga massiliensis]
MSPVNTHILRAVLEDDPGTLREIETYSEKSLSDLAKRILEAFGFYPQETSWMVAGRMTPWPTSDRTLA